MKNSPILNNLIHENNTIKKNYNDLLRDMVKIQNENDVLKSVKPEGNEIHKKAIHILQMKNAELNKKLMDKNMDSNGHINMVPKPMNIKKCINPYYRNWYNPYYDSLLYNQDPNIDIQNDYLKYMGENID